MRNYIIIFSSIFFLFFTVYCQNYQAYSLNDYIELAIKNNPQIEISLQNYKKAQFNQKYYASTFLPHIYLSAQTHSSGALLDDNFTSDYGLQINVNQLIFDFGKTFYSYKATKKLTESADFNLKNTIQEVRLNAKIAYYNFLLAEKLLWVSQEALNQAKAHLNQAKVLYETGKTEKYSVTKAEVSVADAQVSVINAKNALKIAKLNMDLMAGMTLPDSIILTDSLNIKEAEINLDEAINNAFKSRPDFLYLQMQLENARLRLLSAKGSYFPQINASVEYGYNKMPQTDWKENLGAGLYLTAPIYLGGSITASVKQTEADFLQAQAQLEAKKQQISNEIKQYYLEKKEAEERILATQKLIEQSIEGLNMTLERFTAGVATPLEVTDAETILAQAKSKHAQAVFDYRVAHAKLLYAIGTK
jgi:outer membrane protein TolC